MVAAVFLTASLFAQQKETTNLATAEDPIPQLEERVSELVPIIQKLFSDKQPGNLLNIVERHRRLKARQTGGFESKIPSIPPKHKVYAMRLALADAIKGDVLSGDLVDVVAKIKAGKDGRSVASGVRIYHTSTGPKKHEIIVSVIATEETTQSIAEAVLAGGVSLKPHEIKK